MTTNCIQDPKNYIDAIFTTGLVGWPGAVMSITQTSLCN